MSSGYYLFLFVQFLIGALVGKSVSKEFPGPILGFAIAILLGMAAIVELIVAAAQNLQRNDLPLGGHVISTLFLGFVIWGIALTINGIGYGLGLFVSKQLGHGGWQFGIPTLLAFAAVYAVVAAMALKM